MIRIFIFILAVIFFIIGIITLPTPLPIGIIFIGISIALSVTVSKTARNLLRKLREKYPGLNRALTGAEKYMPAFLLKALKDSTPEKRK